MSHPYAPVLDTDVFSHLVVNRTSSDARVAAWRRLLAGRRSTALKVASTTVIAGWRRAPGLRILTESIGGPQTCTADASARTKAWLFDHTGASVAGLRRHSDRDDFMMERLESARSLRETRDPNAFCAPRVDLD